MQHNKKEQKNQENPGGRPPKAPEDRKTVQLKIWVTPAQAAEIRQKAELEGFKYPGQYMSKTICDGVRGTTRIIRLAPHDMGNLGRIGNNLNQIAKHLNNGGNFDQEMLRTVIQARNTTGRLFQELNKLIKRKEPIK
jgi:hypothetical protein